MLGDGYFYHSETKSDNGIGLRTTEKPFALSFQDCLKKLDYKPRLGITRTQKGTPLYQVRDSSLELAAYFRLLEINDLRKMIGKNKELITSILRGFYESEGCVGYSSRKKDNRAVGYKIRMGGSLKEITEYIFELTKSLRYNCRLDYEPRKYKDRIVNMYRIVIQRKEDVIRFFNEINPCIKRTVSIPFTERQKNRVEQYNKVLELFSLGLGYLEISRKLSLPETTVWYWVKGVLKPRCLKQPEVINL